LGYPEQALERSRQAVREAEEHDHPMSLALVLFYASTLAQSVGDISETQRGARALVELAVEHGMPYWLALGNVLAGWAQAETGDSSEGIACLERAFAVRNPMGAGLVQPYALALLAEARAKSGDVATALLHVDEALALADAHAERHWKPELHRIKAELVLRHGDTSASSQRAKEAEDHFLEAIAIAREQRARSLELRATVGLSRFWHRQGKTADAVRSLSEIHGWFKEGFGMRDHQAATQLLVELRGSA
jgi:predicted ATPase